jgi:hypothetical protein
MPLFAFFCSGMNPMTGCSRKFKVCAFRYSWWPAFALSFAFRISQMFALSSALSLIREPPQPQYAQTCYKHSYMRITRSNNSERATIIYAE